MRRTPVIIVAALLVLSVAGAVAFVLLRTPGTPDAAALAVTSVTPSAAAPADSFVLSSIAGTAFQPGAFVTLSRGGEPTFPGRNALAASSTLITGTTFDLALARGGAWDVTVTLPDGSRASCVACFTVSRSGEATASVDTVVPSAVRPGTADLEVKLSGAAFQDGASVAFSGPGIVVRGTTLLSSTSIAVTVSVASDAPPGARGVTVTNPDLSSATCAGCFTVSVGGPAPASVQPNSLPRGAQRQEVRVQGTNFQEGATLSFGAGIAVASTTVTETEIVAVVSVAPTASPGSREFSVTKPDKQRGACGGCFAVQAGPATTGVEPGTLAQGSETPLVITGTGFLEGAVVSFSGTGLTAGTSTVSSATRIETTAKVAAGAAPGQRTVRVTNPDGGTGSAAGTVTVVTPPPVASSVTPSTVAASSTVALVITGTGFQPGASVSFSGAGLSVVTTTVASVTRIQATVDVLPGAVAGRRNLTVTNADLRASTCTGCVTIAP